jgi:hypothetical protein
MGLMKPKPTRREQQLMVLTGLQTVQDLESFLNSPLHPDFRKQSRVPDEEYDLLERERQDEEELYASLEQGEFPKFASGSKKQSIPKNGSLFSGFLF